MRFRTADARLALGRGPAAPRVVRLEGHLLDRSPTAEDARTLALGLLRAGVAVGAHVLGADPDVLRDLPDRDCDDVRTLCARLPGRDDVVVQTLPPAGVWRRPSGGYQVARALLHPGIDASAWVAPLRQVDEVWAATAADARALRGAGVGAPVHVVPHGIDTGLFHPDRQLDSPVWPLAPGTATFLVPDAGRPRREEEWTKVLDLWRAAFDPGDSVALVLHLPGTAGDSHHERRTNAWLATLLRRRGAECAPVLAVTGPDAPLERARSARAATAAVVPDPVGTTTRRALEVQACGRAVVFAGEDGAGRAEAADLLRHLAREQGLARRLGAAARAEVAAVWTTPAAVAAAQDRLERVWDLTTRPPRPEGTSAVHVRWEGEQFQYHSLSGVNREITSRLCARDDMVVELVSPEVDPEPVLVRDAPSAHLRATGHPDEVGGRGPRNPDVTVRHEWPPRWDVPATGAWVVVQPWEFGAVPQQWIDGLQDADEVWCPSTWLRDCYEVSGFPADRLHVVPNGVDELVHRPDGPRLPLQTRKGTRLLFCGGPLQRKGLDLLVRAYRRTFTAEDDVCLVVKAHGTASLYTRSTLMDDVRAAAADPRGAELEVIDRELDPADVAALYRACDVLVHPYRGEAFALPVAEAMACGLPVVVTDRGGASDFCDARTAFLVPSRYESVPMPELGPAVVPYFLAEPDEAALGRLLRSVVEDPVGRAEVAARGRRRILEQFTWDRVSQLAAERVLALADRVPLRERPVRDLDTRARTLTVHVPVWTALAQDDVLAAHLEEHRADDGTCLVLPVDPDPQAFARAASALQDELVRRDATSPETADLLLVPHPVDDVAGLRALVSRSAPGR